MKLLPILVASLLIVCILSCGRKQEPTAIAHPKWKIDTIINREFCYLPDTCIMDSGLFSFTSNLAEIGNICYSDSITDGKKYYIWYKETEAIFLYNLARRNIEIDLCLNYISMNIIPEIKKYGNNCTAANGEAAWLNCGIFLYKMFSEQENIIQNSNADYSHLWEMENDAWLRFIAKLFPLIEYEICDVTGSSAAYEIPITLSKIIQDRIDDLTKSENTISLSEADYAESLNRLEISISSINTLHYNWEKDELEQDSFQLSNKREAIETLHQWIAIRLNMASLIGNNSYFINTRISLLDSTSSAILHIRH